MAKYTNYEKETIILFNDDEDTASVYTCNAAWIRKMDKLALSDSRITLSEKDDHSKTYIIPKKAVKIRLSRVISGQKRKDAILRAKQNLHKK